MHDYNEGIYFVTICTAGKRHIFGQFIDGKMVLNHVVMPNYNHVLMQIVGTRPEGAPPYQMIRRRHIRQAVD